MPVLPRENPQNTNAIGPIVSAVGGPTEVISALADKILGPYVNRCRHVVRNSIEVIRTLENSPVAKRSILATLDVKSLYLRIPQEEGSNLVLDHHYRSGSPPRFRRSPDRIFEFILKDNFLKFADRVCRQTSGIAMGTRCAPNFANIFMASKKT